MHGWENTAIHRITGVRVDAEGGEGDDALGQGAFLLECSSPASAGA